MFIMLKTFSTSSFFQKKCSETNSLLQRAWWKCQIVVSCIGQEACCNSPSIIWQVKTQFLYASYCIYIHITDMKGDQAQFVDTFWCIYFYRNRRIMYRTSKLHIWRCWMYHVRVAVCIIMSFRIALGVCVIMYIYNNLFANRFNITIERLYIFLELLNIILGWRVIFH